MILRCLRRRSRLLMLVFLFISVYFAIILITSSLKFDKNSSFPSDDYFDTIRELQPKQIKRDSFDRTSRKMEVDYDSHSGHSRSKCKEKTNIVFIKCMKCATETMGTIIRRFGYTRNLSFVTPYFDKLYLGWPYLMKHNDFRPSSRGYNIIMEHAIYNKTFMEQLMPKDTVYVSIIREPFRHVKSTINYFKIAEIAKIPGDDPLREYFYNTEKYETVYQSHQSAKTRYCIPDNFTLTKNLMSHCLGMPVGFPADRPDISDDPEAVHGYIKELGRDFHLMMLVEYLHESLVLLKRKMCWTFKDIVYKSVNSANYTLNKNNHDPELVQIYKKRSSADYALYDHFNKTFWKQVAEQGPDFYEEVAEYSKTQTAVAELCDKGGNSVVPRTKWSPGFTVDKTFCKLLDEKLLKKIQLRHDQDEKVLLEQEKSNSLKQKPQALC